MTAQHRRILPGIVLLGMLRGIARMAIIALIGTLFAPIPGNSAQAQTKVRVGKAQAQTFAFVPADVGVQAGLFKQRGLDVEISNFAGDARLLQASRPTRSMLRSAAARRWPSWPKAPRCLRSRRSRTRRAP
jgi:hypothetical protein